MFYLGRFSFLMSYQLFGLFSILLIQAFLFTIYFQLRHRIYLRKLNNVLYSIYFFALFGLLLLRREIGGGITLNPLSFISDFRNGGVFEVAGNLMMLAPLGILLHKRTFLKTSLLVLVGITIVEVLQYVLGIGFFDLGDIVLGYTGFFVGYEISNLMKEFYKRKDQKTLTNLET